MRGWAGAAGGVDDHDGVAGLGEASVKQRRADHDGAEQPPTTGGCCTPRTVRSSLVPDWVSTRERPADRQVVVIGELLADDCAGPVERRKVPGPEPGGPFEVVEVRGRRGVDAVDLLGLAESPDLPVAEGRRRDPGADRRVSPTAVGSGVPLVVLIT